MYVLAVKRRQLTKTQPQRAQPNAESRKGKKREKRKRESDGRFLRIQRWRSFCLLPCSLKHREGENAALVADCSDEARFRRCAGFVIPAAGGVGWRLEVPAVVLADVVPLEVQMDPSKLNIGDFLNVLLERLANVVRLSQGHLCGEDDVHLAVELLAELVRDHRVHLEDARVVHHRQVGQLAQERSVGGLTEQGLNKEIKEK